jgi:hypothetical protein
MRRLNCPTKLEFQGYFPASRQGDTTLLLPFASKEEKMEGITDVTDGRRASGARAPDTPRTR